MYKKGIVLSNLAIDIDEAEWISKTGDCRFKSACSYRKTSKGNDKKECESTLYGHCCKHVVNGDVIEKEKYRLIAKRLGIDNSIPASVQNCSSVVENYRKLSREVLKDPFVSASCDKEKVRIACSGRGATAGMTDFLSFESDDFSGPQYKHLGIISSYFNFSNPELYTLYRLVHKKYFKGINVSTETAPVDVVVEEYGDYRRELSQIEKALGVGPLLCLNCSSNYDRCVGVVYSYYRDVYSEDLKIFYASIMGELSTLSGINRAMWRDGIYESKRLNELVKREENIYVSKIVVEYLQLLGISSFMPEIFYGGKSSYTPNFAEYFKKTTGRSRKEVRRSELNIQSSYVQLKEKNFENHYRCITGYFDMNAVIGSIDDHVAFSLVNYLVEYFLAVYVWAYNCCDEFGPSSIQYGESKKRMRIWEGYYDQIKDQTGKRLIVEWLNLFEDIYKIESHMNAVLYDNLKQ